MAGGGGARGTGDRNYGANRLTSLLILSQVILSLQLPFAVVPLVQFTSDRAKMGEFTNRPGTIALGWFTAAAIVMLNVLLLWQIHRGVMVRDLRGGS